ncbi:MAG: hypothetical protein NTW29_03420 [Bacteroidetes bacterium]|nr:hypothetical protein [Bacteroidota bacterium]
MKSLFFLLISVCCWTQNLNAQSETFDISNYTAPKGWKKAKTESSVQFTKEDAAKGTYCIITLLKSVPGTANAKDNFDAAWEAVVKEMVPVKTAPEMQPAVKEDGWEAQSGYSTFTKEDIAGVAMLVTTSGFGQMVNIVVLTNSDTYGDEVTNFLGSVSFIKKENAINNKQTPNNNKPVVQTTIAKKDGFAFTTTNFDDGWNSTVQEDWVEVTKGNIKVLIHYPREGTIFPADPEPLTNAAWNILVAPRYSNLKNYKTTYITTYNRPYLGMGYATENSSGKNKYIVFFRQGQTGWIEFITPDKNTFIQQFKFDPETIRWDSESELMNNLSVMTNYNKFAIAQADFKGSWTSDFTGIQQMYSVYTGEYAGMNMNQSSQTFEFGAGNTYKWNLVAVNGMVGNMKYAQVKSAGKFSVLNNWQVQFSDIEGKPQKYDAYFSCIKGARILWLQDAVYKLTVIVVR